jgi:hypothetical protein
VRRIILIVAIIIALLASGFFYLRGTPHYSLYMLKRAIQNHNPDEALKYVNIDSIVDNLSKTFFEKDGEDNVQASGKNSSLKRMVKDALPDIKESVRSSFRAAVAARGDNKQKKDLGKVGSNNAAKDKLNGDVGQDVPRGKLAVQEHKGPGFSIGGIEIGGLDVRKLREISLWSLSIQADGKVAEIQSKDAPGIKAKMVKTDSGYWQVVEILLLP